MVKYIRSNQVEELTKSAKGLNAKDVWYKYFDGFFESVDSICEILGVRREDLTEAYIPNGVTRIGDWAFENCTSLTSVTIPDGVKSIGDEAFYGCTSLKSIIIPDSVKEIREGAFKKCPSLIITTNNPYVIEYCMENDIDYIDVSPSR